MSAASTDGRQAIRTFVEHEHDELLPGIDRIHAAACDLTSMPVPEMRTRIFGVLDWIDRTLRPHMAWEEGWLYPQVDQRAETPWATRLIRFDHHQINQRAERLAADRTRLEHGSSHETLTDARCDLLALEALLRAHVEREERFLIPLIDGDAEGWTAGPRI